MKCRSQFILLLILKIAVLQSRKINDDLVYQHEATVRQRMSEVRHFLVPLPEDQWDQLLHHFGRLLVPVYAASDMCRNHSLHLLHSFLDQEVWALRMIDASSKWPSGLLDGYLHNLGNYAQCLSVEEPNKIFSGQHCVIETTRFLPPEIYDKIGHKNCKQCMDEDVAISLCVPSSCSDHDVYTHIDHSLAALGVSSKSSLDNLAISTDISKISCTTVKGLPFRTKDYCAMITFASLILVVLLATLSGAQTGYLSYFSLSKNLHELMDTRIGPEDITCLSGLKVLLILSVIMCHRWFAILLFPNNRLFTSLKIFDKAWMKMLDLSPKVVDVFLLIGGTLLSHNFFMKIKKREDFNFISFCMRRYFRVTPALAAVALYHATLLVHSSQGPLWLRSVAIFEDSCHTGWWATLLHISNFLVPHRTCVSESWYVACDFHSQCFASMVLLLVLQRPRLGLAIASLCFILSTVAVIVFAFYVQLSSGYWVSMLFWDRLTDLHIPILYRATIFRVNSFILGLALGYALFYCRKYKPSFIRSMWTAWLGWLLCVASMFGLMLVNMEMVSPDHEYMPLLDPLYVGFSRLIYCTCFAWVIFACHTGCGGWVNRFLSWPGFRPLAKLVYSVFLVHVTLQALQLWAAEAPIIFSFTDMIFLFLGDVIASFGAATALYTTVEMPFYMVASHIIKDSERSKKNKTN